MFYKLKKGKVVLFWFLYFYLFHLLKSPTAIKRGSVPTGTGELFAGVNVPSPCPKSMETVLASKLAVARSKFPSSFKSPTEIERGALPIGKLVGGPNVPSPSPKSMETSSEPPLATARI